MRIVILFVVITTLIFLDIQRNQVWRDNVSLWEDNAKKSPYNTRVWLNLSVAYGMAGRSEDSLRAIEKALTLFPEPGAFLNLARIMEDRKRPDEAMVLYNEALKMADNDPLKTMEYKKAIKRLSYFGIGNIYFGKKDYVSAEGYYRKSLEIDPEFSLAWNNLGYVLLIQKRCKEALSVLEKALLLAPEDSLAKENIELANRCIEGYELRLER